MTGCMHAARSGRPAPLLARRCDRPTAFLVNETADVCALHVAEVLRDLVLIGPVRVEESR